MHIHFRQGAMLDRVAPLSADTFAGGVIMPNLVPPVADAERLAWYTAEVQRAVGDRVFDPYMTLFSAPIAKRSCYRSEGPNHRRQALSGRCHDEQ